MDKETWQEDLEKEDKQEEEKVESKGSNRPKIFGIIEDKTPEKIHCRNCHTLMENGVCPTCGFKMYVPMDPKKQKMIRWISGGICVVIFIVLLIVASK